MRSPTVDTIKAHWKLCAGIFVAGVVLSAVVIRTFNSFKAKVPGLSKLPDVRTIG